MHKVYVKESEDLQLLLDGCRKENRKSQELLYKQFYSYGMSIAFRYAGNRDEAAEILNDSFMKVFKNLKKYDSRRSFATWFRTIVINTAINQYKRYLKHAYHEDIAEAKSIAINQNALDEMAYEEILGLIQKLTPGYRTVFSLYVIDGHSHEEISQKLGNFRGLFKIKLVESTSSTTGIIVRSKKNRICSRGRLTISTKLLRRRLKKPPFHTHLTIGRW